MAKTKHVIHMVGHGHIDPTWLWRWTEGYEEVRATFRSALDRMKETPDFTFTASSACFYAWVKVCDPEMFEEIRARVKEGRWEIVGGWWVEPDCNIPEGEAFVRHGLYSQRFFEREFGVRARAGFNPDSFGHAGTLPQILRKMDIEYYAYMRPEPPWEMQYPEGTTFRWRAKDGSEVVACAIPHGYAGDGERVIEKIKRLPSYPYLNPGQKHILGFYGVGNHGGGPTKQAIAAIRKAQKDRTLPDAPFSTLEGYFEAFLKSPCGKAMPSIDQDLQHHARGCYSAHSEMKRMNRKAEHGLMAAERLATAAGLVTGRAYSQEAIEKAWQLVLYNQFHDILAGTSIEVAYEDTRDQLGAARNTATEIWNEALQMVTRSIRTSTEGNTMVVVNPLPWPVKQTVKASAAVGRGLSTPLHVVDDEQRPVACQPVLGERIGHTDYVFTVEVPGLGYRCFRARTGAQSIKHARTLEAGRGDLGRYYLESDWWRMEFDPTSGEMRRLRDKRAKIEVLNKGNVLACLVDQSDTWSHGYDEWRVEAGRFGGAVCEILESGDVRATVRITQTYRDSTVEQFVSLYRDDDAIDCLFRVNWQERYTMLKLGYETNIVPGVATYDVPYGFQERNTEGWEEPGQKWVDLTGTVGRKKYGLAVLNDSKYSFDVRDGAIRVTLLRSPAYAFHDRGRHDSSEPWPIMDQGWQTVRIRLVPHSGSWEEADVVRKAWELNEPASAHLESSHGGTLPQRASFLEASATNVVLTAFKRSEDGDDLVVRGYETAGKRTKTRIRFPHVKKSFEVMFGAHEIKTLRVDPRTWKAREVNLLEER